MGRAIDYEKAREILATTFDIAEREFREGKPVTVSASAEVALKSLFQSKTQAFREALIGCCLARMLESGS